MAKISEMLGRLGAAARKCFSSAKEKASTEPRAEQVPKYRTDAFWLYRWIMDWKYNRVGLTTITWMGEEYGYRMDVERIPKTQLDDLRRSTPYPVHRSNCGWNEWVLIRDSQLSPFPDVKMNEDGYYTPTAIDLDMYLKQNSLDQALTFKKKNQVPIDGKMLLLCIAGVAVLAFFMLGTFS